MNGWTKETKNMGQGKMAVDWNEPRRGRFQSLRTKLIVYFCLVFVVVLLAAQAVAVMGVPFTSYGGRLGQQKTEAFRSLNLIADLKKDRLLRWLERRRHSADAIFDNDMVRANVALLCAKIGEWVAAGRRDAGLWAEAGKEKSYGYLANYLNNFRTTYGKYMYDRIFIAEANTGKVFISTDVADLGTDISRKPYFTGALASPNNYVDKVQLAHRSQSPVFHVSRVIHDTGGKPVAVGVIEINLDDITVPMLHTGEGLGKGGEALLVNQNSMAITRLKHSLADGTRFNPLEYQIRSRPAILAARGEDGIIESEDYRGEPVLAAYRFIPVTSEWGWGMVVKRDKAELYAPLRLETTYSIFISLAGVLAVVGLTVVMARNLTQPILSLSQVAHKVSEGDFAVRASVTTSDEVGKLAWTFNSMLQRIASWHRELEEEVKARTAELNEANEELKREIDERMDAEAALRESEEKFRNIFEESPIGIELYNADGYLLEGNKACLDIFGVSDLRDVKGFQLFEDPNLSEAAKKKLLEGEAVRYEVVFDKVKSEGLDETTTSGLCHLDVLISPLGRKGQGALGGFLVQLQDIIDRKQAEKALRKRTHDLGERVKELNCLYDISKLIERLDFSWEQVFQGIAGVIPSALQYPEVACARIVLENHAFETENFLETSWKLAKAIIVHGERIGYVEAGYVEERPEEAEGPFLLEERGLINAIAERLGRVLERKRSEENIRALSQQLMQAHEIERQKIASDLHDNLAQDLSSLKIGFDTLFDEGQIISEKQRKRVFELSKKVQQSITVVRDLAYDLHPAGLQQLGLVDTLRSYCDDFAARYDKKVDFFSVGLDQAKLDFETQITLYRSVQEGLTNVRKHADAGHVTVRLSASFPYILLRIEDDGKGFDPEKRFESVSKGRHMGLLSMEQRVAYLNGEMIIESRPMQGTKIVIKFPCQEISNER